MTRQEQRNFVDEMLVSVKVRLLNRVADVPEDWCGVELREWIKDTVKEVVPLGMLKGSRRRKYVNDVVINNL